MERRPVILVLRNDPNFVSVLLENGCEVINLETVVTEQVDHLEKLAGSIGSLDRYDGFFLTSPAAATGFLRILEYKGKKAAGRLYVLGQRTKAVFEAEGFEVIFISEANTAAQFIESFDNSEFNGKRFLFIRGDRSMRTIPERLGDIATIDELVVYRTIEKPLAEEVVTDLRDRFRTGGIDWVCVFSPSGFEGVIRSIDPPDLDRAKFAVIGDTTARHLRESGLRVDLVSQRATTGEFAEGLIRHIKNIEQ